MNFNVKPNGVLEINNARICYRNFSGIGNEYNNDGDRNFALIIPDQETVDRLSDLGWNIKVKEPKTPDGDPMYYMPIKIRFKNCNGPAAYIESGDHSQRLDEDTISRIDKIDIDYVDMDIRPYDWTKGSKSGRSAYLNAIWVYQKIDRFAERFASINRRDSYDE